MFSPMMRNVTDEEIAALVAQSEQDGVQKMVVGALILRQGKILLLQRHPDEPFLAGLVELPSGTVEAGEALLTTLKREIGEETGLRMLAVEACLGHFDYVSQSGKKTRQFNFLIDVAGGDIVLSSEHSASYWVDSEEGAMLNISPETRTVIEACLSK